MMRFDVISIFPEMFQAITKSGITAKALKKSLYQFHSWNPRDYTSDRHRTVDDRPYGGGPGMVMQIEPLRRAIHATKADIFPRLVICMSPQGEPLTQQLVAELAQVKQLVIVSGRYEGIDERLLQLEIDREVSVGDYVLSGGELAAMVLIDAIVRLLPGALGHSDSAQQDSFQQGLLDCPHYTRPEVFEGMAVPNVLLSGDHAAISRWRSEQALLRTALRRPDLLAKVDLDAKQKQLLADRMRDAEAMVAIKVNSSKVV